MTSNECPIPLQQLPAAVQKNVGPGAPGPLKLMAARGLAPMTPRDLVTAQFVLTFEAEERIAKLAAKSLADMDPRIANAVLSDTQMPPVVLGYLARTLATQDANAEKLLLNPATPTAAFLEVGKVCSEQICEIIASNQKRILEEPEIARSLDGNPNALKSTVERVIDFLVRNGAILDNMQAFESALLRLNGDERLKAADAIELPDHLLDERFLSDDAKGAKRRLIAEDEEVGDDEDIDQPLEVLLRTMNAAQKVALATKGDRRARGALMRDTNRIVALAAITSPCVTEPEVLAAANSRTVHQDVIAHICRDKKNNWVRNYQVKAALVANPKTPLPEAMKLVPTLNARDLKSTAKSRNVPMGVRNLANNLVRKTRR